MAESTKCDVLKLGADFPSCNGQGFNAFRFSSALGSTPGSAFQVNHEEFDELLFRHAAARGVDAHEDARVTRLEFSVRGATAADSAGTATRHEAA